MKKRDERKAWWSVDEPAATASVQPSTIMDDDAPVWSGIYDARGNKLMRERGPFGFRRR